MADAPTVHIGQNSPEFIAYKLLEHVMNIEGMSYLRSPSGGYQTAKRDYVLDTYAECLTTVKGLRVAKGPSS